MMEVVISSMNKFAVTISYLWESVGYGAYFTDAYARTQEAISSSLLTRRNTDMALIVVTLTAIILLLKQWASQMDGKKVRLPPGRMGIPLIGDTITFVRAFRSDGLKEMWQKKADKYGPIFKTSVLGDKLVILDAPAGNKFVLTNDNTVLKSSWPKSFVRLIGKDAVILKSGEEYKQTRRHLLKSFLGPDALESYLPKMERSTLRHLESHWQPEGSDDERVINVSKAIKQHTFSFISDVLMSIHDPAELEAFDHEYEAWSQGLLALPVNLPGFIYHKAVKAKLAIENILRKHMIQRRKDLSAGTATPDQDLLSILLTQKDENGHYHTEEEILDNMRILLSAGHHTTASVLTFTIDRVARDPQVYEQLLKEHSTIAAEKGEREGLQMADLRKMKYSWMVIQEVMRMWPPVVVAFRETTEDVQYSGYTIPKGWKITWTSVMANRNPEIFPNPDKFDPSRFEKGTTERYGYLPFGSGPRRCPGNELAKMQLLLTMHYLLKNFRWSLLDPNENVIRTPMPETPKGTQVKVTRCKTF